MEDAAEESLRLVTMVNSTARGRNGTSPFDQRTRRFNETRGNTLYNFNTSRISGGHNSGGS